MGPIEISLNVDKGSASATFVSANAEVRDAIETAMPRLREMFASAGIQLGQTNVSSESFRQQSEGNSGGPGRAPSRVDNAILAGDSGDSLTTQAFVGKATNGLVDLFA
jgi:flagellar hook-length control protein FliK